MRRALIGSVLAVTVLVSSGCRGKWPLGWRPPSEHRQATSVTWQAVDPNTIEVIPDREHGVVRYRVHMPPSAESGAGRRLTMVFKRPLDGAEIDAFAEGPDHAQPLGHDRRVGNNLLVVPLGGMSWDTVDLVVHHHLRQPPTIHAVRVAAATPVRAISR